MFLGPVLFLLPLVALLPVSVAALAEDGWVLIHDRPPSGVPAEPDHQPALVLQPGLGRRIALRHRLRVMSGAVNEDRGPDVAAPVDKVGLCVRRSEEHTSE